MNVATRGDVVVVLLQLGVIDNAAELVLFLPVDEDVGDTGDAIVGNEVLRIGFLEDPAGEWNSRIPDPALQPK
jgi:hypothetical protein